MRESYCIIMCLHPINGYDNLDRPIEITKYQHELNNCDYFELTDPIVASHRDLLVMQLNIRGLLGKLPNLKELVNKASRGKKTDIILLCETWQNKNSRRFLCQVTIIFIKVENIRWEEVWEYL